MKKKETKKIAGFLSARAMLSAGAMLFSGAILFTACSQESSGTNVKDVTPGIGLEVSDGATPLPPAETAQQIPASGLADEKGGQTVSDMELAPGEAIPITEEYFPDPAFREYLLAYMDKNKDRELSQKEREAVKGLGSVGSEGGLLDAKYSSSSNMERGEKLRAIKSLEGIEYFTNLQEIYFAGGYQLEKLPLNNPNLETVQLEISTIQDFSLGYTPKLRSLSYMGMGAQDIAWDGLAQLEKLKISSAELEMEDLAKCRMLTSLSLYGCVIIMPENPETFDFPRLNTIEWELCDLRMQDDFEILSFSRLPALEKFSYSESKGQETMLAKELDFGENEHLKEVSFGEKEMAEKIILSDLDTYFSTEADWAGCEVVFMAETMLDTAEPLPEGSIWLTAENFPDVAFRQYLYYYVDEDKDHILTQAERSNIQKLSVWDDNPSIPMLERQQRAKMLGRVYRFDGIEYLEDLREFSLGSDAAAVSICLDNPRLLELTLPRGLKEFSISNAEELQSLTFYSKWGMELDLSGMQSLRKVWLENISADFSYLLQNQYLTKMYLEECESLGGTREIYDFSGLKHLSNVNITLKESAQPWADCMCFGDAGYFSTDPLGWDWIQIGEGVTKKVILESKNVHCEAVGAEIVYLDDVPGEDVKTLPEGSIWNGTENIADLNFRCYLYQEIDKDRDNILTLQEREELIHFADTGYDYNYGPGDEVNEYKWKVEDDFLPYVYGITSLEGFAYFPNLKELQLEKMDLSEDVRTIVISNPELEVLDLRFNGNVETIDLTACKKLRVCVIDSTRDKDFVQEIKPTILLPEHLQLETIEGLDCVIGKGAQERNTRKK